MRKLSLVSLLILSLLTFLIACSKSNSADAASACDGASKNFTADVNPLIQTYCNQAACHDAGSINGPGSLTNYTEAFNARADIRGMVAAGLMPQNTTLTPAQKNTIICWIDSGALNN